MTTLHQIVKDAVAYMEGVEVVVDRLHEYVTIRDLTGMQEDIFLQGSDGAFFIEEATALYEQAQTVSFEDAAKAVAKPYVACLWG